MPARASGPTIMATPEKPEVLLPKHFIGMAIIGLGLAAIDGRPYAGIRRRIG